MARRRVSARKVRLVQVLGHLKRLVHLIFDLRLVSLLKSVNILEPLIDYAPARSQFLLILVLLMSTLQIIPLLAGRTPPPSFVV